MDRERSIDRDCSATVIDRCVTIDRGRAELNGAGPVIQCANIRGIQSESTRGTGAGNVTLAEDELGTVFHSTHEQGARAAGPDRVRSGRVQFHLIGDQSDRAGRDFILAGVPRGNGRVRAHRHELVRGELESDVRPGEVFIRGRSKSTGSNDLDISRIRLDDSHQEIAGLVDIDAAGPGGRVGGQLAGNLCIDGNPVGTDHGTAARDRQRRVTGGHIRAIVRDASGNLQV